MRLDRDFRHQYIQHEMRTYGRKNGFVTQGQKQRLERWLPEIGLPKDKTLSQVYPPDHGSIFMEIGFGNGDFLVHLTQENPDCLMLGIEIYLPGIAKAVARLEDAGTIHRCRISQLPAQYVLQNQVAASQLDGIYINHPDPWPKKKHHKRRLIQKDFALLLATRLKPSGFIKLASDKPDLAEWMCDILDTTPSLINQAGVGCFSERDPARPQTKFEKRGVSAGRKSLFLYYLKDKTLLQN